MPLGEIGSRPQVHLIAARAQWFADVVADNELPELLTRDLERIVTLLGEALDLTVSRVDSKASWDAAIDTAGRRGFDLTVLLPQVWAEDWRVLDLLEAAVNEPLLLWCYLPTSPAPAPLAFRQLLRYSGPVGALQYAGTINNAGRAYHVVVGSAEDSQARAQLTAIAQAAAARRRLRASRIGLLPHANPQMISTWVDEYRLRLTFGCDLHYLSAGQLAEASRRVSRAETKEYVGALLGSYRLRDLDEEALPEAARLSLGLAELVRECGIDILSLNDVSDELHRVLHMRPCLMPPALQRAELAVGLEGDLGAALAVAILKALSKEPVLFAEIFTWSDPDHTVTLGHGGLQDPRLAGEADRVVLTPDHEYQNTGKPGVWMSFRMAAGPVTMLQIRHAPQGFVASVIEGTAAQGEREIEGYPHAVVRLPVRPSSWLRSVLEAGSTQHWAVGRGHWGGALRHTCEMTGIALQSATLEDVDERHPTGAGPDRGREGPSAAERSDKT